MGNKLHVGFKAPLNEKDTREKTYGCRANNPDICKNNCTDYCAFCREDGMCIRPPMSWGKQYDKLSSEEKEN